MSTGTAPARALALLRDGLDSLLGSGRLRGVRDDSPDAGLARLLLTVSPARPDLYVELFLDSELFLDDDEDGNEDDPRLVALVNWIGSEDDPAMFDGDADRPEGLLAQVVCCVSEFIGPA